MTWYTLYERTLTGTEEWNGWTVRQVIPVSAYNVGAPPTGTQIRVTLQAGSAGPLNLGKLYIGHGSATGDIGDFDNTQVLSTFSGGFAANVSPAGALLVSDPVNYVFRKSSRLVLSGNANYPANFASAADADISFQYQAGDASGTSDITPAGTIAHVIFKKVEIFFADPPGNPTCTINKAMSQADPTSSSSVVFALAFNKGVSGLLASEIDLSLSTVGGTLVSALSGSDLGYTLTVTGMLTAGNVVARIPSSVCVDTAGNPNQASTSTDNSVAWDPDILGPGANVYEVTTVDRNLIRIEVRDRIVEKGYTEILSSSDAGTGTYPITGAVSRHGQIELTTSFAAIVGGLYITAMANNGSGGIRCTVYSTTGIGSVTVRNARGCTEANGTWSTTIIDGTHFDLVGPTFVNTYTGGATIYDERRVVIHSVGGTIEANTAWASSRSGSGTIVLQGSVFTHTYTSGGTAVDPTNFVQRANPYTGLLDYCLIVGREAKQRRFQDIRAETDQVLDKVAAAVAGNYSISGGLTITNVYLKTKPYSAGSGAYVGLNFQQPCLSFRHYIYLKLSGNLSAGSYTIVFPPGTNLPPKTFVFNDKVTRCCAIKASQAPSRPGDPGKLAYLSEWVPGQGTHGEWSFSAVTDWHLINSGGSIVWSAGAAPVQRATPTSIEGASFDAPATPQQYTYQVYDPVPMRVTNVTKANPGVVTVDDASSISNGSTVAFVGMSHYLPDGSSVGMWDLEMDSVYHTVTNKSGNTFQLNGLNTSGYTAFAISTSGNKGNLCFRVNNSGNRSQTYVYGLNYSAAPLVSGETYHIYLPNRGVSDLIEIRESAWNEVAAVYAKGLYHERMGCVLDGRFGYTRPVNFKSRAEQRVYKSYLPYAMSNYALDQVPHIIPDIGYAYGVGGGYAPWITTTEAPWYGGHADAGDWDLRFTEVWGGLWNLLNAFEHIDPASRALDHGLPACLEIGLDPTIFAGTDDLPAPVVEVIWGIEFCRQSQDVSGAVSGGMNYGEGVPDYDCSWNTPLQLYTWYPDHLVTYQFAAVAAKLSRILSILGYSSLATTYRTAAIAAYNWSTLILTDTTTRDAHYLPVKTRAGWTTGEYNDNITSLASKAVAHRANAAASLFYLTGDSSYKTVCDAAYPVGALAPDNMYGAWEYAMAPGANSAIRTATRAMFTARALATYVLYNEAPDVTYANGQYPGFWSMAFGGANNFIDSMPTLMMAAIIFDEDGDTTNANRCRRAMQYSMQHRHGANQIGISMTNGIGVRNLLETLHLDSRHTSQALPLGLCSEGWANNYPLLPVFFGNSFINRVASTEADPEMIKVDATLVYRELRPLHQLAFPRWEMLMERYDAIEHMEYTTQQQLLPAYPTAIYLHGFDGNDDTGDVVVEPPTPPILVTGAVTLLL